MIVCSCNVLTRQQILDAVATEPEHTPRTPAQTYRCLGCAPDCGRCLVTVRSIIAKARVAGCDVGCAACPSHGHHPETLAPIPAFALAAE